MEKLIYETYTCVPYVPLLYWLKMSAHSFPDRASLFATMFLNHSMTEPWGVTNFHKSALLLPIVVSSVTWNKDNNDRSNK